MAVAARVSAATDGRQVEGPRPWPRPAPAPTYALCLLVNVVELQHVGHVVKGLKLPRLAQEVADCQAAPLQALAKEGVCVHGLRGGAREKAARHGQPDSHEKPQSLLAAHSAHLVACWNAEAKLNGTPQPVKEVLSTGEHLIRALVARPFLWDSATHDKNTT